MTIHRISIVLTFVVIFTTFLRLLPAEAAPEFTDKQAATIGAYMDDLVGEGEPGYAVGIVIDGDIVFSDYAGLALIDTPTPINEETRFNIASVAKQFTALMVLDLARGGQIDLSADFRTYLPGAMPSVEAEITVAHLITHTSGIRDVYDLFFLTNGTWYESDFTNGTALDLLEQQRALNFDPGTSHRYSNSNYILLAELIAGVTGEPFPAYAKAFFEARGMEATSARRRQGAIIPNLARAYGNYGSGWIENPDIANTYGDGFMYATLSDLLTWETQVWGHGATLDPDLIRESQAPLNGSAHSSYGYGLEFGFYRGLPITYHEGATGSYNTYVLRFPEQKVSIVTTGNTNQVNAVALARVIANFLLKDAFKNGEGYPSGPPSLSPFSGGEAQLGLYAFEDNSLITLTRKDGDLYREMEWADPVRLIQKDANLFHHETDASLKMALSRDADGRSQIALYSPDQVPKFAVHIPAVPEGKPYRQSLEGTFYNRETDTEIILEHTENDTFTMIKNKRPRTLTLMGRDYLVWNAYRIRVLRDDTGRANGLSVDRNRIRNVMFIRTD
ncbi:MAG: serine hydrolase domain-containing protein [Pseudomonadota bacterium]